MNTRDITGFKNRIATLNAVLVYMESSKTHAYAKHRDAVINDVPARHKENYKKVRSATQLKNMLKRDIANMEAVVARDLAMQESLARASEVAEECTSTPTDKLNKLEKYTWPVLFLLAGVFAGVYYAFN